MKNAYGNNSLGYGNSYGYGQSMLSQYGSDPQKIRDRLHNSSQYGSAYTQGVASWGAKSSTKVGGVTNPSVIREQISSDIARGSYYY